MDDKKILNTQVDGNHYKRLVIQPAIYGELNGLRPLETKAIKYITRNRFKHGEADIDKAIHCLELFRAIYYGDRPALKETIDKIKELLNEIEDE
jgi:hypothetical protein